MQSAEPKQRVPVSADCFYAAESRMGRLHTCLNLILSENCNNVSFQTLNEWYNEVRQFKVRCVQRHVCMCAVSRGRAVKALILIVCVDDRNGMLFNHRRQSQDRFLRRRILNRAAGSRIWMNAYSAGQFSEQEPCICMDPCFTQKAGTGEYCFLEDGSAAALEENCEQIILYRWNRHYPADLYFDIPLAEHGWKMTAQTDFPGSSHEKLTEEVYIR